MMAGTEGGSGIERALCPVLIGREKELSLLEDALLTSLRGEGRVVVLAGDAGIGKTRLAGELSRRATRVGCVVMTGSCSEADLALAYLPFVEALGNYVSQSEVDDLRIRLGPGARELAQLFPQLGIDRVPDDGGDPSQARLRLFEAMLSLMRIPSVDHGLLLLIEDLQWSDASTRELLEYVSRRLIKSRIMVLATYRREEMHYQHPLLPTIQGWRRSGLASVVELEPMSADGVADMMRAIFEETEVTDEFRDFMHARTEGNPFVLEEILKTALDRKDIYIRPETGHWDRKTLPELQLPPTIRDMILLRLERLTQVESDLIRTASVLGRSFNYATLMAVSGGEQLSVEAALLAAAREQLLEEDPVRAGGYRFRHALTQEAIYQSLSAPQRERTHLAAAAALRARSDSSPADLAHHLIAANRWAEAEPVCLAAAAQAKRHHGYREAAALYERVLTRETDPLKRARVQCLLGEALQSADVNLSGAVNLLEEGVRNLEQHHELREAAHYRLVLGRCQWEQARPALARGEFERVRTLLEPDGPSEDLALAYVNLGRLDIMNEELQEGLVLVDRAIDVAEASHAEIPRIWAQNYRGFARVALGMVTEGLDDLDRSYQEAVEHDLPWLASTIIYNRLGILVAHFQLAEALKAIELYRSLGIHPESVAFFECSVRLKLGEPALATRAGENAVALANQNGLAMFATRAESRLALALAAEGRFEEARGLAVRDYTKLDRQEADLFAIATLDVYMAAGDIAAALPHAQAIVTDLRQRSLLRWDLELLDRAQEALVRAGRFDEAGELVERARTAGAPLDDPYLMRIEGRHGLVSGDLDRARHRLRTVSNFFAGKSCREEEWRTRRLLAEVDQRLSDGAGAVAGLRAVLSEAEKGGHVAEADAARRQLLELGVEVAAAARAAPRPDAPRQVAERFLTVMFVDIRGYTAVSAETAPADLADRVATFYRWTEQEIARHHGVVAQYGGDAVMATFNVSGFRLDHCLQALQAAIAIRDKAAFNGLPVGVGIAVGPAVVGQLSAGSPVTAVGETINLAARLQATARAGEVVLTREALRRVKDWLQSEKLDPRDTTFSLKGFKEPVLASVLPPS